MAHQHALARSRWTVIGTRYGMWNTQLMMNDNQGRMSIRLLFFWLRIAYQIDVPLGRRRRRLKYFLIFLMLSSVIDRYAVVTGLFLYFSGHVFYTNGFSLFFFIYFISPDLTELKLKKKKKKRKKIVGNQHLPGSKKRQNGSRPNWKNFSGEWFVVGAIRWQPPCRCARYRTLDCASFCQRPDPYRRRNYPELFRLDLDRRSAPLRPSPCPIVFYVSGIPIGAIVNPLRNGNKSSTSKSFSFVSFFLFVCFCFDLI